MEAYFRFTFILSLEDMNAGAWKSVSPLAYFSDMFSSLRVQVKGGKLRTELSLLPHVTSQGSPKLSQPGNRLCGRRHLWGGRNFWGLYRGGGAAFEPGGRWTDASYRPFTLLRRIDRVPELLRRRAGLRKTLR